MVVRGFDDARHGQPDRFDPSPFYWKTDDLLKKIVARRNKRFLAAQAQKPGVKRFSSGLLFMELKVGSGSSPGPNDTVGVRYWGRLMNGQEFESTYGRGNVTAEFRLDRVVPCWTEAITKMKPGERARFICPAEIGFGVDGVHPRVPPMAVLIFELELVDFHSNPTDKPPVPEWMTPPVESKPLYR
jgi:FKBP-type peptidyl-prolyl cis-trans isomerase FkpA